MTNNSLPFVQAGNAIETRPSPSAERIVPLIDQELKKKYEKAAAAKEKGKRVSVRNN